MNVHVQESTFLANFNQSYQNQGGDDLNQLIKIIDLNHDLNQ